MPGPWEALKKYLLKEWMVTPMNDVGVYLLNFLEQSSSLVYLENFSPIKKLSLGIASFKKVFLVSHFQFFCYFITKCFTIYFTRLWILREDTSGSLLLSSVIHSTGQVRVDEFINWTLLFLEFVKAHKTKLALKK